MRLFGVDGCAAGWVVATSERSLRSLDFAIYRDFHSIVEMVTDDGCMVIDVPIGLSENGARICDIEARRLLGAPRSSSVFPPPCRTTLQASTYEEACRLNALASGKKITQQTFAILPKIREVDAVMTPEHQRVVREAHPEVIFAILAGTGRGLIHNKKRTAGERERIALLASHVPHFDPAAVRTDLGAAKVERNDIIDAVACLVAAYRFVSGQARVLPDGHAPRDTRGLRMEIIA